MTQLPPALDLVKKKKKQDPDPASQPRALAGLDYKT
jgi:hypothetical protein